MARVPSRHSIAQGVRVVGIALGVAVVWFLFVLLTWFAYSVSWSVAMISVTLIIIACATLVGAAYAAMSFYRNCNKLLQNWENRSAADASAQPSEQDTSVPTS